MMVVVEYAGGVLIANIADYNYYENADDDGSRGICRWCPDGSRWVEWRNLCRAPAGQREVK